LLVDVLSVPRTAPPLHDLLGVSFVFNSPIAALAWDRDFACFGLQDGAVAMLRAHWEGAPELAPRPGGGIHIIPASGPPAPPAIFGLHKGPVTVLGTDPLGGIVSGGVDGVFQRLIDGEIQTIDTRARRRVAAVAAGRGGRRAFAVGRDVDIKGPEGRRITLPAAVTALRYDPSGLQLAIGFAGGVSLEACGIRTAPRFEMEGAVTSLAWRADGGAVAAAFPNGVAVRERADSAWEMVEGLAGTPTAIGFLTNGTLMIAGAGFLQHWRSNGVAGMYAGLRAPLGCHPHLEIFAAAGAEGQIILRRAGMPDAMILREPGPTPIFIAFSPDGQALAFAAKDGEAGTMLVPDLLFRASNGRSSL
jgi:hypothetical protein